jgi:hypothetical protein
MIKKSTTWYFPFDDLTSFFNLQKSQSSNHYYVNTGAFTDDISNTKPLPPEYRAGIRLWILDIIPDPVKTEVDRCLHLEQDLEWEARFTQLVSFLRDYAVPMIARFQSRTEVSRLYSSRQLDNAFITMETKARLLLV